jgi:ATP-binding cassette subfamily B protein/subfamily B ATP-binding cassette protein MsbA
MISPEVKKILRELIPFKKTLIVIAIAGLIMGITQARVLMLSKDLMDSLNAATQGPLLRKGLLVVGLTFISGLARYFNVYMMNFVGEQVTQNIRHRLQRKFMTLNLSFHNSFQAGSGGLISRILNDIIVIQNGLRMFADFFSQPVIFIALISWMFYLNWKLTASIFIVLPLILWFLRQISKTIKTHSLKGQEDLEKITSTIKESLDGVRIIQSFNLEDEMSNRFLRESDEYLSSRKKIHQRVEMAGPVTEFIATAVTVGILVYLGSLIAAKQATIGDFVGYVAAILGVNPPIKKIQESYVRVQETIVAAKRVYSLLEQDSEVPQTQAHRDFPQDWKTITYRNVSFSYGAERILKNINLTIHRGEVVAFVGASGSGKSSLVNLLERFFDPTEGEILIDDIPIHQIRLKDLRSHIALVTQDVFLFSDTVERNIWAGDFSKKKDGVPAAAQSANAHNFIAKQGGYQYRVGDRGNLLSGGEKQRVSIARAIFKDAPILILDEATSALDSASEIEVQKGLDHLMEGRTALVIAHRLSTVSKADKIIVMKAGEIIETGTHQALLEQAGEYAHLHTLQKT